MADVMIERLRAAIRAEIYRQGEADDGPFVGGGLGEMAAGERGVYLDGILDTGALTRAILTAMRIADPLSPILGEGRCTTGHWNRMIDAILAETA